MRRSLVIYDFAPDPSECHNIWGKFSFLFYQCTLYCTCRGWRSYSAKCCKTRRCLKEMSCRYIAEYFTDKTNMRVIKAIKTPASWLEAGRQVYFKTRYPVACFYGKNTWKSLAFFISCKLQEINSYINIKGAIFFDEKNRRSIAQAFFLALGSTVYCYDNDMETKASMLAFCSISKRNEPICLMKKKLPKWKRK